MCPPGIFGSIVVSRKGAFSCPVASGVIFAVNVDTRVDGNVPEEVYSKRLLATMQARAQPLTINFLNLHAGRSPAFD